MPSQAAAVDRMIDLLRETANRLDVNRVAISELFEGKAGLFDTREQLHQAGLSEEGLSNNGESAVAYVACALALITLPRVPE